MSLTVEPKLMTADELWQMPESKFMELVKGRIVEMAPPGYAHGSFASRLARWIGNHVEENNLGEVIVEGGFILERNPDTVRSADVAFICKERNEKGWTEKFFNGPPDLAIEVISPDDRFSEVNGKAAEWVKAGCKSVWIVDPGKEAIYRYENGGFVSFGETVRDALLPGFSLEVAALFRR